MVLARAITTIPIPCVLQVLGVGAETEVVRIATGPAVTLMQDEVVSRFFNRESIRYPVCEPVIAVNRDLPVSIGATTSLPRPTVLRISLVNLLPETRL